MFNATTFGESYRGADKSLARPGRKQATATEDFDVHILFIIIIGGILVLYYIYMYIYIYTGLFISPSVNSELDCATTKTDTAERSISIGRESRKVFFVLGALAYLQVPPLGASRDEKWRAQ